MKKHTLKTFLNYVRLDHHKEQTKTCPGCDMPLSYTGINKLAYTMDVCTCRTLADYDHVVEQVWHKTCLVKYLTENPEKQMDYRYLSAPSKKSDKNND